MKGKKKNKKDIATVTSPSLKEATDKVVEDIVATNDPNELKDLTTLFNICMTKKNILRAETLNNLVDRSTEEMLRRIEHHPGEFSHTDLINYLNVAQSSLDKIAKSSEVLADQPVIVNQTNTQININGKEDTSKEEIRRNVLDAMDLFLQRIRREKNAQETQPESPESVDKKLLEEDNSDKLS